VSVQLPSSADGLKKLREHAARLLSNTTGSGSGGGSVHGAGASALSSSSSASHVDPAFASPVKTSKGEREGVGGLGGGGMGSPLTPLTALKRRTQVFLDENPR
jgi:hypothetical protein